MKIANNIRLRVFTDKVEGGSVRTALIRLMPFNAEEEKITFKETEATGIEGQEIIILETEFTKQHQTTAFLKDLFSKLSSEDKSTIKAQLDSRIDEACHFFIRIDKEELLQNKYKLTDSGNCFHIMISVAAFPSKKEVAKQVMLRFLE
jgi:RNA binding exosome subunit